MEKRWLTLDMIASTLRLPASYIKELTKQRYLVTIGSLDKRRWLDPTPEYAEKLRLAAILHDGHMHVPPDINEIALLSLREVAELCGWSVNYARNYMKRYPEIPRFRVNSQLHLYSITTVREILWRRQGRKLSKQRSPFLIAELVAWVKARHEAELQDLPTDAEYAEDDAMMRKLELIVRRSEKDQIASKHDFASKVELARKVVQILENAKPVPTCLSPEGDGPAEHCTPVQEESAPPQ
jgi:hypothetical protein